MVYGRIRTLRLLSGMFENSRKMKIIIECTGAALLSLSAIDFFRCIKIKIKCPFGHLKSSVESSFSSLLKIFVFILFSDCCVLFCHVRNIFSKLIFEFEGDEAKVIWSEVVSFQPKSKETNISEEDVGFGYIDMGYNASL